MSVWWLGSRSSRATGSSASLPLVGGIVDALALLDGGHGTQHIDGFEAFFGAVVRSLDVEEDERRPQRGDEPGRE